MGHLSRIVRRAMLAALFTLPWPALAEVAARFDADSGTVRVSGLPAAARAGLLGKDGLTRLRVAGLKSTQGMPLALTERGTDLVITPRFALRAGTSYALTLRAPTESYTFEIVLDAPAAPTPVLTGFAPSQAVIPANTLRLYLRFSEPMARGQIRAAVSLYRGDGSKVSSPFLALGPELWDPTQTRATLLFDPGRLKQGVGPNARVGSPLEPGQAYRLVVSGAMKSAKGARLGQDISVTFRAGPPERRAVDPTEWQVLVPEPDSTAPLTITFDRIVDSSAVNRLLLVTEPSGNVVRGRGVADGGGWSFTPDAPWAPGTYHLIVDPAFEDVAGNRPVAAFDAQAGTMGAAKAPITVPIHLGG